jgi:hypothetical protein
MFMYDSGTSSFSYKGEGGTRYDEHIIISMKEIIMLDLILSAI